MTSLLIRRATIVDGTGGEPFVAEVARAEHAAFEQRTLAEIAAAPGLDPLDAMLDLALADDLRTVFTVQLLNSDEHAVARLLTHPHGLVSLSDAGAHPTFFNDAGFGLHLPGHWVCERGVMTLAEAVGGDFPLARGARSAHDAHVGRGPRGRRLAGRPPPRAACPAPAVGTPDRAPQETR